MADTVTPIPPGRSGIGGIEFDDVAFIGRVGDGLVYAARLDGQPVRLREYAPAGLVQRDGSGGLEPAEPAFAQAWEEAQVRFLDLAGRLATVPHSALPRHVHAFAHEDAQRGAFLVTRPSGAPLSAALAAGMALPPDRIMRIAADLADALATLHAGGIAHLDIAPDTVSIASGGVELTDLAIDNRPFIALAGSQDGFVRPGYSPIERSDAAAAEPLGPRTDIYAASALLYRLIEGRDPEPWEQRWRDSGLAALPDRAAYPPAFLAALRRGMAIEPGDRFADGAAWRAAMALPGGAIAAASDAGPPPPPARPPAPAPAPSANWLVPLLIGLILLALAGLGYVAYRQGWFDRAPAPQTNVALPAPVPTPTPSPVPPPDLPPQLTIGSSVAGRLATGDTRYGTGQLYDAFAIDGQGGERIDIQLSSSEFDPVVNISGPGLTEGNDDDPEAGGRDSRLRVTLPRAGRYTVTVTSYSRGEVGAYLLRVDAAAPEPVKPDDVTTLDLTAAARLNGRWRTRDDGLCANPAVNSVTGSRLTSRIGGTTHVHDIVATDGDEIRTLATSGPASGRSFTFRLDSDGDSYEIAGETWLRC